MADEELMTAIKVFERRVDEAERKANTLRQALNALREDAGLSPRPPSGGGGAEDTDTVITEIKNDTFFGKKQQTAVREYLQMRRTAGVGPATPREIYDALVEGGFKYEAKDAKTALVGLRAMLRKRTNIFIKVGDTGTYGLTAWYPDARKPKATDSDNASDDDDSDEEKQVESRDDPDDQEETADEANATSAA